MGEKSLNEFWNSAELTHHHRFFFNHTVSIITIGIAIRLWVLIIGTSFADFNLSLFKFHFTIKSYLPFWLILIFFFHLPVVNQSQLYSSCVLLNDSMETV